MQHVFHIDALLGIGVGDGGADLVDALAQSFGGNGQDLGRL